MDTQDQLVPQQPEEVATPQQSLSADNTANENTQVAENETKVTNATENEASETETQVNKEETAENIEAEVAGDEEELAEEEKKEEKIDIYKNLSETELTEKLQALISNPGGTYHSVKADVDAIKNNFYRIVNAAKEAQKEKFVSEGGEEADFAPAPTANEQVFKETLAKYKEKRNEEIKHEEAVKEANLTKRKDVLLRLQQLIDDSTRDFGQKTGDFKALCEEWKAIGQVPIKELAKVRDNYKSLTETFYDNLKINNELRELDFKKNLEAKTHLCEQAEALDNEPSVVEAFKRLQTLHDMWSDIGPVAKEFREQIWNRFKAASSKINKKHNDYFDALRSKAQENLEKKEAICEQIEKIDTTGFTSFKQWSDAANQIKELQKEWKKIGFAPKKFNTSIYERFRTACDKFFGAKSDFQKAEKAVWAENYAKKVTLCEQAEALKDSTDWKNTTDKLVALQKEWKTIGPLAHKQSEAVWKRFNEACDAFFNAKNKLFKDRRTAEHDNLKKKRDIIEQIQTLEIGSDPNAAAETLHKLIDQYNETGHVPFKEKDNIYREYKAAIDEKYDALNMKGVNTHAQGASRGQNSGTARGRNGKPLSEKARLQIEKEKLESQISTYENNIGFLASSSADSLKSTIEKRIADMKAQLAEIEAKLKAEAEKNDSNETKEEA